MEVAHLVRQSGARCFVFDNDFISSANALLAHTKTAEFLISLDTTCDIASACLSEELVANGRAERFRECLVDRDDAAWFFHTSGTTGLPKAAILTHGQLSFVIASQLADVFPGANENDTSLILAPLSHGAGVHSLAFVARAAAQVMIPGKHLDAQIVWETIERHCVTNFFTVPTMLRALVEHPAVDSTDHSSLRFVNYGGAPLMRGDLRYATGKIGPVMVQHYGLAEFTAAITSLAPDMHHINCDETEQPVGTCGYARTGAEIAIMSSEGEELQIGEEGEVCVRGPAVFAGYYDNPAATEKAFAGGWFHTGDIGRLDSRGLLYLTGRASDMYISGGTNIYPREAEELILDDPRVAEVAVVGVPDEKWGEVGVAVVVMRQDQRLTGDDVIALLQGKLARFKMPKRVIFWESLPKSGYGKILKREISRMLASGSAQ